MKLTYSIADQSLLETKSIGILNVSLGLLEELARREDEVASLEVLANSTLDERLRALPRIQVRHHDEALGGGLRRALWDQLGVYAAAARGGSSWLFLPKGYSSFCRRSPVKLAVYVHDAMIEHYRSHRLAGLRSTELVYFRACLLASLREATVVFTNTEFTRSELQRLALGAGVRMPPIHTVGYGCNRRGEPSGEANRLAVLVSPLPHKRTAQTLRALARWHQGRQSPVTVCLIGALPAHVPLDPRWESHSRLEEPAYRQLMGRSRALVYSSEYEGFGLPPLEALLAGVAPVYSDIAPTREVMGGRGFPFTNGDDGSMARALDAALQCPPAQVSGWADELAQLHRWSRVGDRILQALRDAQ